MSAEIVSIGPWLSEIAFTCEDCGQHVVSLAPPDHTPICACCRFLREQGPSLTPEELGRIRRLLDGERPPDPGPSAPRDRLGDGS